MKRQPTTSSLLRRLNRSAVVDLIRTEGVISPSSLAERLNISLPTVNTYIRRIYEKLQVRTRTEAVAKFLRR